MARDATTVDHKNHNTLDNRRRNLRFATQAQQNANRLKHYGGSRFKGVYLRSDGRKWVAQIKTGSKARYLGSFETEELAARAYNREAKKAWGKFAKLNDIN